MKAKYEYDKSADLMNQTHTKILRKDRWAVLHLTQDDCLHPSEQCAILGTVNFIICHSFVRLYIQHISYHIYRIIVKKLFYLYKKKGTGYFFCIIEVRLNHRDTLITKYRRISFLYDKARPQGQSSFFQKK